MNFFFFFFTPVKSNERGTGEVPYRNNVLNLTDYFVFVDSLNECFYCNYYFCYQYLFFYLLCYAMFFFKVSETQRRVHESVS